MEDRSPALRIGPTTEVTPAVDPDPGPFVIDGDGWNLTAPEDGSNEAYRGIRRAGGPGRRVWVSLVAVFGLGAVVAIGLTVFPGGSVEPETGRAPAQPAVGGVSPVASPTSAGVDVSAPGVAATAVPVRTSATVPFAPVTYEAEAGPPLAKLRGSAEVVAAAGASGGRVVRGIGNGGQDDTGSIQFRALTVPTSGTYRIAVTYVPTESTAGRTAALEVDSLTATATFASGSGCCAVTTVDIVLTAGTHTIILTNPNASVPAIDKIMIARA